MRPRSEPLKVGLLFESDGPGGAEQMLLHLAEGLRERGHKIYPIGPANLTGWLAAQLSTRGFSTDTYSYTRTLDLACVRQLSRIFRSHHLDVVHSHEFDMAVYGAAAARVSHVRHVITMHGGLGFATAFRRRVALRWAAGSSSAIVAVSEASREVLARSIWLEPARVVVVPNGIAPRPGERAPVRAELGLPGNCLLLLAVGNLYTVKGHAVLLRALAGQRDTAVNWHLAVAGRGYEEPALRALAKELDLSDRVSFLGYREDVPNLLASADIFVMPSLSEGLPLALLEAMFAGKAIVASRVGGIPEATRHEQEALLVPPNDAIALRTAITQVIDDSGLRARLAANATSRAHAQYSLDTMTAAYEAVYRGQPVLSAMTS